MGLEEDLEGLFGRERRVMRAVLCKEWGDPSTLVVEEIESGSPSGGEVRISVGAAGVNFADALMVAGRYQFRPPFPFSPGFEVSGVIEECGEDVEGLNPGDRVMAALPHGGYAEEVVVPATNVVSIPDQMDFPTAATFPVAYGTAHLALTHRANLGEDGVLLVHGAAGNVGRAAVEIGKRLGATVIATAGGPDHLEIAAERGADHTIDYEREDVKERVESLTDGAGADVIFDPVGGDAFDASLRCVAWEGVVLVVGFASGRIPEVSAVRVLLRNCAVVGLDWGGYLRRYPEMVWASTSEALSWYTEGMLRPQPSHLFSLEEAPAALEAQASRNTTGKVVLTAGRD